MSQPWYARLGSLIWGVLGHVFEYLPKIIAALEAIGFDSWAQKIREARQRGGMAADDFVEENEPHMRASSRLFRRVAAVLIAKADTIDEIADEGIRVRESGEIDAFTEEQMERYIKALLDQDREMVALTVDGADLLPSLERVAAAEVKQDVSESPTLNA